MAAPLKVGDKLANFTREIEEEKMILFERVVWDRGSNSHSDPEAAKRDGMSKMIASGQNQMAFYHEMLERNFGDAWVYGGKISARYIHPVYVGDRLTCQQKVTDVYDKKGGALWFVVSDIDVTGEGGKQVARARSITVVRNPTMQ